MESKFKVKENLSSFFFLLYLSSSAEGWCVYGCVFSGGRSTFISLVFLQSFIHTNCSINKTRRTNYGPAISPSAASSCKRAVLACQRRHASSVWRSQRWAAERWCLCCNYLCSHRSKQAIQMWDVPICLSSGRLDVEEGTTRAGRY